MWLMKNVQLSHLLLSIFVLFFFQEVVRCENVEMKITLKILKKKKRICRKKNLRGPIFASANTSQILFAFIHFKEFPSHKETNKNFSIFFVSYQQRQITWTWMNLKERVLKTVQIEVIMLYTVENDTRKEIFHFSPMLHFYSL